MDTLDNKGEGRNLVLRYQEPHRGFANYLSKINIS